MKIIKKTTTKEKITIEHGKKTIERITEVIEERLIVMVALVGSLVGMLKYLFN